MSTAVSVAPLVVGSAWGEYFDQLGIGLVLLDEHGDVLAASGQGVHLLGAPPDGWRDDLGAALPPLAVLARQVLGADGSATMPVLVGPDGAPVRRLWVELHPVARRSVLVVLRPVRTDALRCMGLLDPLTGLANRVLLFDRLDQALRRGRVHGRSVTLVLADLRGLGTLGAEEGDRLLVLVARRLTAGLGEDRTVARYSGGTFAVMAEDAGDGFVGRVAAFAGYPVRVGSASSQPRDTVYELVRRAHEDL